MEITEPNEGRPEHAVASELRDRLGNDWQPIETAPNDGRRVLVWCEDWVAPLTASSVLKGQLWEPDYVREPFKYQPTHWMPIPEPPYKTRDRMLVEEALALRSKQA